MSGNLKPKTLSPETITSGPADFPGCPQNEIAKDLFWKFYNSRIPLSGSIELTRRCNLNCVHCYIPTDSRSGRRQNRQLTAAQWVKKIDQIAEAGCLSLLITGGEPLFRNDFETIYAYAKNKGMIITVFTNGVLISERHIDLFKDLPPYAIEITLYGATAETYERITRVKGSFQRCIQAINSLKMNGIPFKLKTMLMTLNEHEFFDMIGFAEHLGVDFRFDPGLFPGFGGNRTQINLRLPPRRAVDLEFSYEPRRQEWIRFLEKKRPISSNSNSLYSCGAGFTTFHIGDQGFVNPCLMAQHISVDAVNKAFIECWREIVDKMEGLKSENPDCDRCAFKLFCAFCPAFFRLETGNENIRSEYLCALGKLRCQYLKSYIVAERKPPHAPKGFAIPVGREM